MSINLVRADNISENMRKDFLFLHGARLRGPLLTVFVWIAALLLTSGCAATLVFEDDGALVVIPYRTGVTGQIVVDVAINGHGPYTFALDTGASISVLFENARVTASIEAVGGEEVRVLGMTGAGQYPIAYVEQISVGNETWDAARVALLPEPDPLAIQVDGILGVDFLSRYAVLYSHREGEVRLYPKELVRGRYYNGWNRIALYDLRVGDGNVTALAFDMTIDNVRIPTVFDLGASANMMNPRAARSIGIRPRSRRETTDVWGAFGKAVVATELIVWQLNVGNLAWRQRRFLIGDYPMFDTLNIDRRPAAIAGTDFFSKRDFVIDFAGKRLLVKTKE